MHPAAKPNRTQRRSLCGLLLAFAFASTPLHAQTDTESAPKPSAQAPAPAATQTSEGTAQTPAAPAFQGLVVFQGLPVPGVTVTLMQAGRKFVTVTDTQGFYTFSGVANGPATLHLQMTGFAASGEPVTVAADASLARTELKLMTLEQMRTELKPVPSAPLNVVQARSELAKTGDAPKPAPGQPAVATPAAQPEEAAQRAADGLLINGSVNNAATSQFTLAQRFGNTASGKSLYSFSLNLQIENSALDAKPYSIAGINTTKPNTSEITGGFGIQGPLKIPHLLRNGPNIFVGYQRSRNSTAVSTPGLVPTVAERMGDLSQLLNAAGQPVTVYNPNMGLPYTGAIPISTQAAALLALYPLPNIAGNPVYNYEIPLQSTSHVDALNSNASKTIGRNNQVTGTFAVASTRGSNANLFSFTDTTRSLGLNTTVNWAHTFNIHFRGNLGYQYSRQSTRLTPFWANRANISGMAGITGNDQDPAYWGPPTLNFTSGLSSLTDGNNSFQRNQTNGLTAVGRWNHAPHNITAGLEFRRRQFNYLTQTNPRGTFQFNGSATASSAVAGSGSDFADFLIGIPTASALAFGNADKYLRANTAAAYITDDYRVNAQLTINAGVRWEFGSPASELKNRLVNLDVAPGFSNVAPLLASQPTGSLTGQMLPSALLHADLVGVQPRIGVSWRPLAGSSLLIAGGYGMNFDTSVYQGIAAQMSQQAPLSKSLTVQNSAACPLTLANGFNPCVTTTQETFGVDPNFRVGYLHTWNLRVQRDLPGSLQMVATYLGNKGTRGVQEFLPNTNAPNVPGVIPPCPDCPNGFLYLTSTGNSTRESGQIQLRRRLKSGFTASVLYTYSKSLDDDSSLGGQGAATAGSASIAQDWRNLARERGLSTFDQRHLANVTVQYTTGMGKGGGTLLSGWRGRVYKEWTVQMQLNAGTGLPETPLYDAAVVSGYTSFVRPNITGTSVNSPAAGRFLNRAAYTAPTPGQWGDARRDSITGPDQVFFNTALLRTFRLPEKMELDLQIAAQNALNHVAFSSWVTNINSTQFGLPAAANTMRTVQTFARLRF